MFRGVYRLTSGPVEELAITRGLRKSSSDSVELEVHGPLAVAGGEFAGKATIDGISCILGGQLYERDRLLRELDLEAESDAELIARGYRRYGDDLLTKLRGRYVLVLWDESRQRGILTCDLLATQQVSVWRGNGYLAFASELPDLLSMLPSRPGPDPVGFVSWLGGWYIPADQTFFEGVRRLPPGELLELTGDARTRTYWRPEYKGLMSGSREEFTQGLLEAVERSIGNRLANGAPSGVVLSGGVDSSVVTAIGNRVKPPGARLETYSSVFPGAEYDEGWKVRSLTEKVGIEPNLFEVEPQGSLWLNLDHIKRWELPLQGSAALVDMAMVREASSHGIETILDGQWGDDVFGCSPWLVADRLSHGRWLAMMRLTHQWPGRPTTRRDRKYILKRWGLAGAAPYALHQLTRRRRDPSEVAPSWLRPEYHAQFAECKDTWAWKNRESGPRWWQYKSDHLVRDLHRETRLEYIRNKAQTVGAVSESPLYDFDLIDYCLQIPPELTFDVTFDRPIIRESMQGIIPDDVRLNGKKAVFAPFCVDIVTGPDGPGMESLLTAPDAELNAYVDGDRVRRLWQEERPKSNSGPEAALWGTEVWKMATMECWLRAQADPNFLDEMLDRPDVRPPSVRRFSERPN